MLTIEVEEDDVEDGSNQTAQVSRASRLTLSSVGVHVHVTNVGQHTHSYSQSSVSVRVKSVDVLRVSRVQPHDGVRASEVWLRRVQGCKSTQST